MNTANLNFTSFGGMCDKNIKNSHVSLTKEEFLTRFYSPEKNDKKAPSPRMSSSNATQNRRMSVRSAFGLSTIDRDEFKEHHKKMFQRDIKTTRKNRTPVSRDKKSKVLFEQFKQDNSNTFESAKEANATLGQIVILNTAMFMIGLFCV